MLFTLHWSIFPKKMCHIVSTFRGTSVNNINTFLFSNLFSSILAIIKIQTFSKITYSQFSWPSNCTLIDVELILNKESQGEML
jgi:hypothetical protein